MQILNFLLKPLSRNYISYTLFGAALMLFWGATVGMFGVMIGLGGGGKFFAEIWFVVFFLGYPLLLVLIANGIRNSPKQFWQILYSLLFGSMAFILFWILTTNKS